MASCRHIMLQAPGRGHIQPNKTSGGMHMAQFLIGTWENASSLIVRTKKEKINPQDLIFYDGISTIFNSIQSYLQSLLFSIEKI